jgi:hypothetical protein
VEECWGRSGRPRASAAPPPSPAGVHGCAVVMLGREAGGGTKGGLGGRVALAAPPHHGARRPVCVVRFTARFSGGDVEDVHSRLWRRWRVGGDDASCG